MIDFAEKQVQEIPVVVLDTETTGLYPGLGHRVIEIGAIRYEGSRPVGEFAQLINPERPIEPRAVRIHGIQDEDVAEAPRFADIRPALDQFLAGALLVAHNAGFDADFLGLEYRLALPQAEIGRLLLDNPWACTLQLARRHFHFGYNNLAHVARQLGVPLGRAHRALNDVVMTADVFFRMVRELSQHHGFQTVGDLLHVQGGAIYAPPPPAIPLPPLLAEALTAGRELEILYIDRHEGETQRHITPRYATYHYDTPYLIATCHLRQELRTFRLERILSATLL